MYILIFFLIFIFSQFFLLFDFPGFHYDEAWQYTYAYKIFLDKNFYPITAMNPYTHAVIHWILAFFYKIISPNFLNSRIIMSFLNFFSLCFLMFSLNKYKKTTKLTFLVLICFLPLSFYLRRFFIDLTTLYLLNFSISCFVFSLFLKKQKTIYLVVLTLLSLLTNLAHVLYTAILLSAFIVYSYYKNTFSFHNDKKINFFWSINFLLSSLLLLKMGIGVKKFSPFFLSILYLTISLALVTNLKTLLFKFIKKFYKIFIYLSLPSVILFIFYHFSGYWPLAHFTSENQILFCIFNIIFFGFFIFKSFKLKNFTPIQDFFMISTLTITLMLYKYSPRFYTIPFILSILWISIYLSSYTNKKTWITILIIFILNNIIYFKNLYSIYNTTQALDKEVFILGFKESSRDFRPFQKVFLFLKENNCLNKDITFEDDRFELPFNFLKLTSNNNNILNLNCPILKNKIYFTHIPQYNLNKDFLKNFKNNEIIHYQGWGDLALIISDGDTK